MPLVTDQLRAIDAPFEILFHQPTFHARDEAHRLGIPVGEVAKTVAIETPNGYALAVIPASRRLDIDLVRRATGHPHARLATEAEVMRRFPRYEPGALPPMTSLLGIPVLMDPEVLCRDTVVFATSESESVRVPTDQLLAAEAFRIAPLVDRSLSPEMVPVAEEVELRASTEADETMAIRR